MRPTDPTDATLSRLRRKAFARPTLLVARRLLGCVLCHRVGDEVLRGRIVEIEAYTDDAASHAAGRKRTPRNGVMFGSAGVAYIYFSYGMHHCFNVVTETEGVPGAVLIRGLDGALLAPGPGRACRALQLTLRDNGRDLTTDPDLWIAPGRSARRVVVQTTRIGIAKAAELQRRFYLLGSAGVSKRDRGAEARLTTLRVAG